MLYHGDVNAGIPWLRLTLGACSPGWAAVPGASLSSEPDIQLSRDGVRGRSAVQCSTGHYSILGAYGDMGSRWIIKIL